MRRTTLFLVVAAVLSSGCALVHRYPAYRGKVLEQGTEKPIAGAGVLAVYGKDYSYMIERIQAHLGYYAVLTDNTGRFEIPPKSFVSANPLSWYDEAPRITIYKAGYGNFPGSTNPRRPKHVTTDPPIGAWLPPETEVTFRLPKLTTEEERKEHDQLLPRSNLNRPGVEFPPPGTTKDQIGYWGY